MSLPALHRRFQGGAVAIVALIVGCSLPAQASETGTPGRSGLPTSRDAGAYHTLHNQALGLSSVWAKSPAGWPSLFRHAPAPTSSDSATGLEVTHSSPGPNRRSELTSIYTADATSAYAGINGSGQRVDGQSTWYHALAYLPQGHDCFAQGRPNVNETAHDCYFPTTGQWNDLIAWHDDNHTSAYAAQSIYMGIYTKYPVVSNRVGAKPHLALRLAGGHSWSPTYRSHELSARLRYNHWYNLLFHFVWSTTARKGTVEWWVDGRKRLSEHFATLYTNPDGSTSYNSFGIYNYRLDASWNSIAYFADVAIGPTRESVAR